MEFEQFDAENSQFKYNLRFNLSNPRAPDIRSPQDSIKVLAKRDSDMDFANLVMGGVIALQNVVDYLILKQQTKLDVYASLKRMPSEAGSYQDLSSFEFGVVLAFLVVGLIPFLRIISMLTSEKESEVYQNMESVGLSKATYYYSNLLFFWSIQLVAALIFSILLKNGFLP